MDNKSPGLDPDPLAEVRTERRRQMLISLLVWAVVILSLWLATRILPDLAEQCVLDSYEFDHEQDLCLDWPQ